jgi:hypothetical protein
MLEAGSGPGENTEESRMGMELNGSVSSQLKLAHKKGNLTKKFQHV